MSLIIKGMSLPSECSECLFMCSDCSVGAPAECIILGERAARYSRLKNCPLTEISTPHGRLIDADDLYNKFKNEYCNRNCDSSVQGKRCDHCGVPRALNIILNAPTIIEAEVSE